jgi:hypothetical protein
MASWAAPGTQMIVLKHDAADHVTIQGLTFDANGVGGGLAMSVDGGSGEPATSIRLINNTFRNTLAVTRGPYDSAIYNPVGITHSIIQGNLFVNCGGGISITNAEDIQIIDNAFDGITSDNAIFINFVKAPFAFGHAIRILRNTGTGLSRMGVELWSQDVKEVYAPQIERNSFKIWNARARGDGFGISVMTGQNAVIRDNELVGGVTGLAFGIEIGVRGALVENNIVKDFAIGIGLHDSAGTTVRQNSCFGQEDTAIQLTNAPGSRESLTIEANDLRDPKRFGIWANSPNWGGSSIVNNSILRGAGAFSDDAGVSFTGIASTPPDKPVSITNNLVRQYSGSPARGFNFLGIRLNGATGENSGSRYEGNVVESSPGPQFGIGMLVNSFGAADGVTIRNNRFEGLSSVSAGADSPGVLSNGNRIINCGATGVLVSLQ